MTQSLDIIPPLDQRKLSPEMIAHISRLVPQIKRSNDLLNISYLLRSISNNVSDNPLYELRNNDLASCTCSAESIHRYYKQVVNVSLKQPLEKVYCTLAGRKNILIENLAEEGGSMCEDTVFAMLISTINNIYKEEWRKDFDDILACSVPPDDPAYDKMRSGMEEKLVTHFIANINSPQFTTTCFTDLNKRLEKDLLGVRYDSCYNYGIHTLRKFTAITPRNRGFYEGWLDIPGDYKEHSTPLLNSNSIATQLFPYRLGRRYPFLPIEAIIGRFGVPGNCNKERVISYAEESELNYCGYLRETFRMTNAILHEGYDPKNKSHQYNQPLFPIHGLHYIFPTKESFFTSLNEEYKLDMKRQIDDMMFSMLLGLATCPHSNLNGREDCSPILHPYCYLTDGQGYLDSIQDIKNLPELLRGGQKCQHLVELSAHTYEVKFIRSLIHQAIPKLTNPNFTNAYPAYYSFLLDWLREAPERILSEIINLEYDLTAAHEVLGDFQGYPIYPGHVSEYNDMFFQTINKYYVLLQTLSVVSAIVLPPEPSTSNYNTTVDQILQIMTALTQNITQWELVKILNECVLYLKRMSSKNLYVWPGSGCLLSSSNSDDSVWHNIEPVYNYCCIGHKIYGGFTLPFPPPPQDDQNQQQPTPQQQPGPSQSQQLLTLGDVQMPNGSNPTSAGIFSNINKLTLDNSLFEDSDISNDPFEIETKINNAIGSLNDMRLDEEDTEDYESLKTSNQLTIYSIIELLNKLRTANEPTLDIDGEYLDPEETAVALMTNTPLNDSDIYVDSARGSFRHNIHLFWDVSGSMEDSHDTAQKLVLIFAEVFNSFQCPFGVMTFPYRYNSAILKKPEDTPMTNLKINLPKVKANGGTPLEEAFARYTSDVPLNRGDALIILTDGQPDSPCHKITESINKYSLISMSIGIGVLPQHPTVQWPHKIESIGEAKQILFNFFRRINNI